MLKPVLITLPKIPGTLECANDHTISLILHTVKLLLKIILQRLRRQILPEIGDNQFCFMKDTGTANAIFVI